MRGLTYDQVEGAKAGRPAAAAAATSQASSSSPPTCSTPVFGPRAVSIRFHLLTSPQGSTRPAGSEAGISAIRAMDSIELATDSETEEIHKKLYRQARGGRGTVCVGGCAAWQAAGVKAWLLSFRAYIGVLPSRLACLLPQGLWRLPRLCRPGLPAAGPRASAKGVGRRGGHGATRIGTDGHPVAGQVQGEHDRDGGVIG